MNNIGLYVTYGLFAVILLGGLGLLAGVFLTGRTKVDKKAAAANKNAVNPDAPFSFGNDSSSKFVLNTEAVDENNLRASALKSDTPARPQNFSSIKKPGSFFDDEEDPFRLP